jgi:hypothetical protein
MSIRCIRLAPMNSPTYKIISPKILNMKEIAKARLSAFLLNFPA